MTVSVCVFGSVARKRCDELSDRDLLVVAPTAAEAESESNQWRASGWSVSPFAQHQITSMSERGSLFIQHLKLEGIILKDTDLFLHSVLKSFEPKLDYRKEMQDSIWLLRFLKAQKTTDWTSLCGADITYVSVRNIAVSLLASKRVYDFSYSTMFEQLHDYGYISEQQVQAIAPLRDLKFFYRNRIAAQKCESTFRSGLTAALSLAQNVQSDEAPLGEPSLSDGYRWLRWLEFNLVTEWDPRRLDELARNAPLRPVWQLIKDPRHYPDRPRKYDEAWMLAARQAFQRTIREKRLF